MAAHRQGQDAYGRLRRIGQATRETQKSFASPSAAKAAADKLIATKQRDGYIEVRPEQLEITNRKGGRKATEGQIELLEQRLGCELPAEYRDFLSRQNGGRPNPNFVTMRGVPLIENAGVGDLFHLQPTKPAASELTYELEHAARLLPPGHLPIAGDSDLYSLSLSTKTRGAVYWWFHETEEVDDEGRFLESAGYLLAGSFDEFLTRIAISLDSADEELASPDGSRGRGVGSRPTIRTLFKLLKHTHTPTKVKEIEQVVSQLKPLDAVQDGEWPFINISDPKLLSCLLKAGLNPEIRDTDRQTLLWQSASSVPCIELLLPLGVDLERRSGSEAETALMRAIFLEAIPAVRRLIKAGANPTVRLPSYTSSVVKRNRELGKVLEQARVAWNKKPKPRPARQANEGTVTTAKPKNKPSLTKLLRLMKCDFLPESEEGQDEVIAMILALGDLSEIQDGQWPIIDRFENPTLLQHLLEAKLNPNLRDKRGRPLLIQCVGHPACIDLLVRFGADVEATDDNGETPFMQASYRGDEDCMTHLLDAGADPTREFTGMAKVLLNMDEEMQEFVEAARKKWLRRKKR
ncbi:MAG: SMI1/KNR4 family protein [Pirellulaceae bacterium]